MALGLHAAFGRDTDRRIGRTAAGLGRIKVWICQPGAGLRAAILAEFPKLSLGVIHARDTGDVVTTGFGISLDLPIFDHNQAVIAQESVTRQKLFDEYVNRFFQTRTDICMLLTQINWLNRQIAAALAESGRRSVWWKRIGSRLTKGKPTSSCITTLGPLSRNGTSKPSSSSKHWPKRGALEWRPECTVWIHWPRRGPEQLPVPILLPPVDNAT